MEEYLERLNNKFSEERLKTLFDKYAMISQDTLVEILADALDIDPIKPKPFKTYYKKHNITYIQETIKYKSDSPGLNVPPRIIEYYIDNIMPLSKKEYSDYDIARKFIIDTDGAQYDDHYRINKYQELIDSQSVDLLKLLMKESDSTKALVYYTGKQTSDIIDIIPTLTYVRHYDAVINQTSELTNKLFEVRKKMLEEKLKTKRRGAYTTDAFWTWVFPHVREPTYEMCERAVLDDVAQIQYVPEKYKTEALYIYVGHNGYSFQVIKYIPISALTQKICENIAANTNFVYDEKDLGFESKLKLIPEKFKNAGVYYYLMKNIVSGWQFDKDTFIKCFEKIPNEYKKKVMMTLIDKTKIKEYLSEDIITKLIPTQ